MHAARSHHHARTFAVLALVAVPLRGPDAAAGTVRGVLRNIPAPDVHHAPNPYPGQLSSLPGVAQDDPEEGPGVADAVVHLTGPGTAPPGRGPKPHPVLDQTHQTFRPRVLGVPVGASVEFLNSDRIYHNVFSYSTAKRFDLGKYPRGQKKTVTFDRPGLVKVFCDIHSNMSAFILVVASRFVAPVASDGSFLLRDVPAGTYEIRAWNPEAGETIRTIAVPDSGEVPVDLEF